MGLVESGSYEVMSAWLNTPLTDLEPANRSSVRQCRQARQFFAESRRLKTFSSITVFFGVEENAGSVSPNVIGYARASTRWQSLDAQVDALVNAGAIKVFMERASNATQARARWQDCLEHLQPGNVLVVADLTRLGRSTADPLTSLPLWGGGR
ncbi:recombinase family protein [Arthrobacter sp.]|uniref:recombinase family protein n=1 Tax=Arthrobacter sp. TaxID=1667 RepID=UPI002811E068|nr:recombinase family protein [Arthrobacter sp.]